MSKTEFTPKLWVCLKDYSLSLFRKDLVAGVTVGIVALPLAMAFAIASGVSPEQGIYTAILAGLLVGLLGGSRVQIAGPTGAFVVIVYGIVQRNGYEGLVLTTLLASVILVVAGFCKLGTVVKYIPFPLIIGFTTGIAVLIFSGQLRDLFGLHVEKVPADFLSMWRAYNGALSSWDGTTLAVGAGSLGLILLVRRFVPRLPWGIVTLVVATVVCWGFSLPIPTIFSRFGEVPRGLPAPSLHFSFVGWHELIPDAFVVAFLAGVESLLCAVVADGMMGGHHKSNMELVAQGVANFGSVLFGGIPATGAIARTAMNIKTGGKTPVSSIIHSIVLFLLLVLFAPLVGRIPLAALSAILIMVAWNMAELSHFRRLLRAPKGDVVILILTFLLTVLVDLTVAIGVGMVLSAFLFIYRMSVLAETVSLTPLLHEPGEEVSERKDPDAISKKEVPPGVEVYEINGPFFFGVADRLKNVLSAIERPPKLFILRLRKVPVLDASGMHALEEFYFKCKREGTLFLLSGVSEKMKRRLAQFGLEELIGAENILPHIDSALSRARALVS
ncbi:MAG: SulP family inorganic anion transporter [Parachlamydiales bacterium]